MPCGAEGSSGRVTLRGDRETRDRRRTSAFLRTYSARAAVVDDGRARRHRSRLHAGRPPSPPGCRGRGRRHGARAGRLQRCRHGRDVRARAGERVDRRRDGLGGSPSRPRSPSLRLDGARGGSPALRGIRHLIHDEQDPHWILRPRVLESLALLEAARPRCSSCPACSRAISVTCRCSRGRFPGAAIVIDHLGKPPIGRATRCRSGRPSCGAERSVRAQRLLEALGPQY